MSGGKLITLEGGEGVGKSTNIAFIKAYLEQHGVAVVVTREPGGTGLGERIRQLLLHPGSGSIAPDAELLLMFAARAQHLAEVIIPKLSKGHWVICDRFTDASYAYQGGGRGIDESRIADLEQWAQGKLRPDLTILLDAPIDIGLSRARERGAADRFESETTAFFERVRQCYQSLALRYPDRFKLIDASQALDEVQTDIATQIDSLLAG